ncbi:hypothetical protein NEOKW01_0145 [Nematocida sp. AWRm80]|nr:hypothetical protein NEOKW01_0145 [Nematocida sp. AWRm80]
MNFDTAMQGAINTLKRGKGITKTKELPFTYTDFFAEKSNTLDHLGLSWRQRLACATITCILSMYFIFKTLFSLITFIIRPESFFKYFDLFILSVLLIFSFLNGFKTFFLNSVSKEMIIYSAVVYFNLGMLFFVSKMYYILKVVLSIVQICMFSLFIYTYMKKKFKLSLKGLGIFNSIV